MSSLPCGCCEPAAPLTPVAVENRAGLSAIAYRVGTYASFRETMLEQIAHTTELARLTTRQDDDYAISIVDLWAAVADVLTFYQERYANEAYLRTATQRLSIRRLARLIDYSLRPGVAALALLAFTVDDGKTLSVPVGLRVQSVPGQNEQPQIFETLEALTADARLNRNRILPAPYGVNPLARGSTGALIAPDPDGLEAAATLATGDQILLASNGNPGAVELLVVDQVSTVEDRVSLSWTPAVQGDWSAASPLLKVSRSLRLFGHTAPPAALAPSADSSVPGGIAWTLGATSYALAAGPTLPLESKVEGIAAGDCLVVHDAGGATTSISVTGVSTGAQALGGLADTVTVLTVAPNLPAIADRRQVTVYQLTGDPIPFWGYAYPERLVGGSVFLPGLRHPDGTIEIGRTILRNAYQPGVRLAVADLPLRRTVLAGDAATAPVAATVEAVTLCGSTVIVEPSATDPTSAGELGLDAASSQALTGLVSAPLPSSLAFTRPAPELRAEIGDLGPRTLRLAGPPTTPAGAAAALQAALAGSGSEPEWTGARVLVVEDRLLVFPGGKGGELQFLPDETDGTTVRQLGLDADQARPIGALLSGPVSLPLVLTAAAPQAAVTIGPVGPRLVAVSGAASLTAIAGALQSALQGADLAPGFADARVVARDGRLIMVPGPVGLEPTEYLRVDLTLDDPLDLDAWGAYLLANVASGSHGQSVRAETLGSGDASASFQRFALKKQPLTYVPSATEGGVTSTLSVTANGVRWDAAPGLYGEGATARVYAERSQDDGSTMVQFGDGRTGATLPSGSGNVLATYRVGAGVAGRVRAGTLTSALDRPPGLRAVTNPLPARGGADPETIDGARENAPTTVRTFGRAVSLLDFSDLVRASGEVAKAEAIWVWDGFDRAVHLTLAGQAGGLFAADGLARIGAALSLAREPNYRVLLDNFRPLPVLVTATVSVDDHYVRSDVLAGVRAAVLGALSFDSVELGNPIHLSELYTTIQAVDGVVACDITELEPKRPADRDRPNVDRLPDGTPSPLQPHVRVLPARPDPAHPGTVLTGELATVEDQSRDLTLSASGGIDG
jgi:hypothetical protein